MAYHLDQDRLDLDHGEVPTGADARAVGEGREGVRRLLGLGQAAPAARIHLVGVVAPDQRVQHGHGEDHVDWGIFADGDAIDD